MSTPRWADEVAVYGQEIAARAQVPGVALGLAQDGELIHFHGFGHRDREAGLPITPDTVFGLGSITKSFTCVAIMQLHEAGKLQIQDPVVRYLPTFRLPDPAATRTVTIHHLMTHTSGLPGLPFLMASWAPAIHADTELPADSEWRKEVPDMPPVTSAHDVLQGLATHPYTLVAAPGEQMNYSNEGYALLGAIIERVSGQSYAEYVAQQILAPAGMTSSGMDPAHVRAGANVAVLYDKHGAGDDAQILRSSPWWPERPFMAAGSMLCSTVRDLLRYTEIFRNGGRVGGARILSAASVQAMTSRQIATPPFLDYGYGLRIQPDFHGVTMVEHGGNSRGVAASMLILPERGITAVALANLVAAPVADFTVAAAAAQLGLDPRVPRFVLGQYSCPPDELAGYAGEYRSEEGGRITVRLEGAGLVLTIDQDSYAARPVAERTFAFQSGGVERPFGFKVRPDGQVEGILLGVRLVRKVPA